MDYSRATIDVNDCLLHRVEKSYPFESEREEAKLRLSWKELTVRARKKSNTLVEKIKGQFRRISGEEVSIRRDILSSVSGCTEAGQMVAIMGPSGAGKTTLLDVLAKRLRPTTGTIRVNGTDVSRDVVDRISSYVPQFDPLPATLTVAEYIAFSCALRLDRCTTIREREILTRDTLVNLGLHECKDSWIGSLSGGEKKLLSLAAEIVTRPRILFLDEPTTGLDTSVALRVIESIKLLSINGIVLCTIHQPSMIIYKLFTHVIFVSDGRTAFSGSLENARTFFESEGYKCPLGFDEVEYYVKILSNRCHENCKYLRTSLFHEDQLTLICRAYAKSPFSNNLEWHEVPQTLTIETSEQGSRWIVQFKWLLWRLYLENRRTFVEGLIAFQYYVISIVVISVFFWDIDMQKQRGIGDAMGVLFMASAEAIYSMAYTPIYEIEREIPLYKREAPMYGPSAYCVATAVTWIPKAVFKAIVLSVMLLAILGRRGTIFPTLLRLFACTMASAMCATAYGSMMAFLIEDTDVSTAVMVPLDLIAMMMAGIYYSLRTLRWYTVGFKYLSIFYYTMEAISIVHWSQIGEIECDTEVNLPCISTGAQVLHRYGYEESDFWLDIMGMSVLTILMNFIGYLGARRRRFSNNGH